jgi:hypothetical protein
MYSKLTDRNLAERRDLIQECLHSPTMAAAVRRQCATDILFWLNLFGWLFEPRSKQYLPFLTYPFQDQAILTIRDALGREDVLIEKSRCMGATWMCLAVFVHDWQFHPLGSYALVSRGMDLVDSTGDPDSLFWKVDCLLKLQPDFLVPKFRRTEAHLENLDLGGTIDGFSTTGNVLRGGRRTAALVDEFAAFERQDGYAALAATQAATPCRIFNSTPQGDAGAFADMAKSGIKKLRLHWSDHPVYSVGLYTDKKGKQRSTWYDAEWKRMPIPILFAQEYDIDYAGSGGRFFPADLITRLIADACDPYMQGTVVWEEGSPHEPEWIDDDNGALLLWTYLDDKSRPVEGQYVIGADISAGTGATNSVLSVADKKTGNKVAELAISTASPDEFAEMAVGLGKFFHDATLIWEMNGGPGTRFGSRVIALGYRNVYWRTNEQSLSKKQSDTPGWHSTRQNKMSALQGYLTCLASGRFVNLSKNALAECSEYIYLPSGGVGSRRAQPAIGDKRASLDPSGARENHGDRPMADALACKLVDDQPRVSHTETDGFDPNDPPEGSFAWRRQQWQQANDRKNHKGWVGNKRPWRSPTPARSHW